MSSALDALLAPEAESVDWPDIFPPRLSPSSVALAAQCPEKWRRKYVLDERESWGGAALIGIAVHRAAEINFGQKIDTHEDLPLDTVSDVAAQAFEDKVTEVESDGIDWKDTPRGEAKDQSVGLYRLYHTVVAPKTQPVAVETWAETRIPGVPELFGRIDLTTSQGIRDIKTTGRKMSEPRGDWRLKGMLYSRMTGLSVEWDVLTKTKTPAVYTADELPGLRLEASPLVDRLVEHRLRATVGTLTDLLERYGPEEPWPTNATEHEWFCSYCSHRPTCAWWHG